jgi:hypothetical protein
MRVVTIGRYNIRHSTFSLIAKSSRKSILWVVEIGLLPLGRGGGGGFYLVGYIMTKIGLERQNTHYITGVGEYHLEALNPTTVNHD